MAKSVFHNLYASLSVMAVTGLATFQTRYPGLPMYGTALTNCQTQ